MDKKALMSRLDIFMLAGIAGNVYLVFSILPRASVFMRNYAMLDTRLSAVVSVLYVVSFSLLFYVLRLAIEYLVTNKNTLAAGLVVRVMRMTTLHLGVIIFIQMLMSRLY